MIHLRKWQEAALTETHIRRWTVRDSPSDALAAASRTATDNKQGDEQ